MPRSLLLPAFLIGVVGPGLLIGMLIMPGVWYAGLAKPDFNPPNWIFAPVWTVLYVLIASAGWRVWRLTRDAGLRLLWGVQLALNFLWSPVFFGAHSIGGALVVILALLVTILIFIWRGWRVERGAALLFLPYLAWVAFASLLNAAIFQLNP